MRESCRFWLGADGRMALVATVGTKAATMTFDADGADSHPGLPAGDLAGGYDRATARLRELSKLPRAANETVTIRLLEAA